MLEQKDIIIIFFSIFTSLLSITFLRPIAKKFRLLDSPNERKNHDGDIPIIGGISIFIGLTVCVIIGNIYDIYTITFLISGFLILFFGFIDDCYPLPVNIRLLFQTLIISSMLWFTELKFETFGHSFGLDDQIYLGIWSYPITILGIIFVTNAFNLMDGADGVAGSLAFLAILGISLIDIIKNNFIPNIFNLTLMGCLIPFLWFNLMTSTNNKIFLGDSGSTFLGYMIACLLLRETQVNINFSPTYALWIIAIPIFDALTVIISRIKNSSPIFKPDRNHLHHILEEFLHSKKNVTINIIFFGVVILLIGIFIELNNRIFSLPVFLFLLLIYLWLRIFIKNKSKFIKKIIQLFNLS